VANTIAGKANPGLRNKWRNGGVPAIIKVDKVGKGLFGKFDADCARRCILDFISNLISSFDSGDEFPRS